MIILNESNDKVSELILNGLSEIARVGHDISEEKGQMNPFLIILKPKSNWKFHSLKEIKIGLS